MNDTKQFLRYLVPGLFFLFQLALLVGITSPPVVKHVYKEILVAKPNAALITLFAGGVVGYLASLFHHLIYWWPGRPSFYSTIIHKGILKSAITNNWLTLQLPNKNTITIKDLDKQDSGEDWQIINTVWHFRRSCMDSCLDRATGRVEAIVDLTHGAGTTVIAGIFAIVGWLFWIICYSAKFPPFIPSYGAEGLYPYGILASFVIAVTTLIFLILSYQRLVAHSQGLINSLFITDLKNAKPRTPTIIVECVKP